MLLRWQPCALWGLLWVRGVLCSDGDKGDGGGDAYYLQVNHPEVNAPKDVGNEGYAKEDGGVLEEICSEWCLYGIFALALYALIWLTSGFLSIRSWMRQRAYLKHLREKRKLNPPVPCSRRKVPPSGTWMRGGYVPPPGSTLYQSFKFNADGTFTGEGMGRKGPFVVRDGRFNVVTGDFMWEEVTPETSSRLWLYAKAALRAMALGPWTILQPVSFLRQGGLMKEAPRSIVTAKGHIVNDKWHLQGNFVAYYKHGRGCMKKLAKGDGTLLDSDEVECTSPEIQPDQGKSSNESRAERQEKLKSLLMADSEPEGNGSTESSEEPKPTKVFL